MLNAEDAKKVNKTGDSMTGQLKISKTVGVGSDSIQNSPLVIDGLMGTNGASRAGFALVNQGDNNCFIYLQNDDSLNVRFGNGTTKTFTLQ